MCDEREYRARAVKPALCRLTSCLIVPAIRNVKFRVLGADLAAEPIYRGGGQIIPSARRVCYSSFLMATPRLQEVSQRRWIGSQFRIPGVDGFYLSLRSPFTLSRFRHRKIASRSSTKCSLAVVDMSRRTFLNLDRRCTLCTPTFLSSIRMVSRSICAPTHKARRSACKPLTIGPSVQVRAGFETFTLLIVIANQYWLVGDPLDKSIVLRPLEPAPAQALARDFMLKTRRRKGLADSVVSDQMAQVSRSLAWLFG